ncbi:MAG: SigB/SigF/SigG family RNA polymerase sigma factor [Clostridia bacterium]|jgi:RNA polymerase sporulation-specific sigma factor|nr:SigB/SigF/SigG family RNA polymerase sigma factor [Clostridia bacterium]
MLEHEETLKYIKLAQSGDENAKTVLLEHNSALIKSIIRRYRTSGIEYDDLYQLGCVGFLKAIKNFDEKYGVHFSTYAVPMITGELKRFMRDDGYIKVSRIVKKQAMIIKKISDEYRQKTGESPTIEYLAKELNLDTQDIVFALDSSKMPISLDAKCAGESKEKGQLLIDKIIEVDNSEDVIDKFILKKSIKLLLPREKQIILLRYFRDKTQSEVAELLGISQVQVSRLEAKVIEKLASKF